MTAPTAVPPHRRPTPRAPHARVPPARPPRTTARWIAAPWIAAPWLILALGGPPGCTGQGDRAETPQREDSPGLHPAAQPATPTRSPPGPDALRGHWTSLDPLGTEHALHIEWPRLRWFVDDQLVRDERCEIHEHRAANLWVRCAPATEESEPSPEAPQIERGLTLDHGELVLLPLHETRWRRQPDTHRAETTDTVAPAGPVRTP